MQAALQQFYMSDIVKKERFHFLDGLRGIASLMIVFHHSCTAGIASFIDHFKIPLAGDFFRQFTQSGVDLFFVLSGVVLLRPYLRGRRKFDTVDYFYRRIKRIYPPYFFAFIFGALVVWFMTAYPTWYNIKGMHQAFSWEETLHEAFIFSFSGTYYNLAWWSLQIEIFFYMLVPVIIYIFPKPEKLTTTRIITLSVITYLTGYAFQHISTHICWQLYSYTYDVANFGRFMEYPLCFLMGIFLASKDFNLSFAYRAISIGLIMVVAGLALMNYTHVIYSHTFISLLHAGYGIFYAGIITLSFNLASFKNFLRKPLMIWFGERSYSIFLIHFSVFYLTDNIVSRFTTDRSALYGILTRAIGIPLALFLAMLLFHFVERRQAKGLVTEKAFWPWQANKLVIE